MCKQTLVNSPVPNTEQLRYPNLKILNNNDLIWSPHHHADIPFEEEASLKNKSNLTHNARHPKHHRDQEEKKDDDKSSGAWIFPKFHQEIIPGRPTNVLGGNPKYNFLDPNHDKLQWSPHSIKKKKTKVATGRLDIPFPGLIDGAKEWRDKREHKDVPLEKMFLVSPKPATKSKVQPLDLDTVQEDVEKAKSPKKAELLKHASAWVSPEHHQEIFPGRPTAVLGGNPKYAFLDPSNDDQRWSPRSSKKMVEAKPFLDSFLDDHHPETKEDRVPESVDAPAEPPVRRRTCSHLPLEPSSSQRQDTTNNTQKLLSKVFHAPKSANLRSHKEEKFEDQASVVSKEDVPKPKLQLMAWIAPKKHQEITDFRPSEWLVEDGLSVQTPPSPQRPSRHTEHRPRNRPLKIKKDCHHSSFEDKEKVMNFLGTSYSPHSPTRQHPKPIELPGGGIHVKDSPFLKHLQW